MKLKTAKVAGSIFVGLMTVFTYTLSQAVEDRVLGGVRMLDSSSAIGGKRLDRVKGELKLPDKLVEPIVRIGDGSEDCDTGPESIGRGVFVFKGTPYPEKTVPCETTALMRGNTYHSKVTVDFQATDQCPGADSKVLLFNANGGLVQDWIIQEGLSNSDRVDLKPNWELKLQCNGGNDKKGEGCTYTINII